MIMLEYQNIKMFLQKDMFQIGLKFSWLKKLNILHCGHMLIMILKEKAMIVILNGKAMIVLLIFELIKMT